MHANPNAVSKQVLGLERIAKPLVAHVPVCRPRDCGTSAIHGCTIRTECWKVVQSGTI
jgi:hypothetical protein